MHYAGYANKNNKNQRVSLEKIDNIQVSRNLYNKLSRGKNNNIGHKDVEKKIST